MNESMQEVIPRLWLGDIIAATNDVSLREKGIHSVLTAMQGELAVHPVPYTLSFLCIVRSICAELTCSVSDLPPAHGADQRQGRR
jgi:hypothetical protein